MKKYIPLKLHPWAGTGVQVCGVEREMAVGPECGSHYMCVFDTLVEMQKHYGKDVNYITVDVEVAKNEE